MESEYKNQFGTAKPYTRHTAGCKAKDDSCRCPKWLYTWSRSTGEKNRYSLNTPSMAEAIRIARDTLDNMNPKVAAANAVTAKKERERVTVAAACDLWLSRTETKFGKESSVHSGYRVLKKMIVTWANAHGIVHVQSITPLQLEKWAASTDWSRLADTTKRQRWGCLRSMFKFWMNRKVLTENPIEPVDTFPRQRDFTQGPYTDEQIKQIRERIEKSIPANLPEKHKVYVTRLRTFIELLLGTGCDVSDACNHEARRIEHHIVRGKKVAVYRYRRQKTNVQAIIPITESLAKALESVPIEDGCVEGMPFRKASSTLKHNQQLWSGRVQQVLQNAGVEYVEVPSRTRDGRPVRKEANVKMFRHTAAIGWLVAGHHAEDVAKMLGHKDTTMIQEHYGPWVKALDEAFVQRVTAKTKRR